MDGFSSESVQCKQNQRYNIIIVRLMNGLLENNILTASTTIQRKKPTVHTGRPRDKTRVQVISSSTLFVGKYNCSAKKRALEE